VKIPLSFLFPSYLFTLFTLSLFDQLLNGKFEGDFSGHDGIWASLKLF
jgi:hypothetical protein